MMESSSPATREQSLLDDLTAPQRDAVTHVEGPLLVLAGAGSGKTRVITRRIAHLVLGVGVPPWNILAITFTNKAAGEMRDRVASMVTPRQARSVLIGTYHSLCARILRDYATRMNLRPGYSIYDTADQTRAVKQALHELEMNAANFQPSAVLGTISRAKNELVGVDAFKARVGSYYDRQVAKIFQRYQEILQRNEALDFDDLLFKAVDLMRRHEDVLAELRERFGYILIDEYQDTNHAQFTLAHALALEHRNLCATGDPDQSIYSWRGADIRNILEFEEHYPDARVVRLEQNYRSTKRILAAADGLIQNNKQRRHKSLWTENETGECLQICLHVDESNEAQHIVARFKALHDEEHLPWSDFAVFYRVNWLSRVMEEALLQAAVPYQVARGTAFYDRKEIKDAVAYLRVIANPSDEVNLLRVINTPARGISSATIKALQAHTVARNVSMAAICASPCEVNSINRRAVEAVAKFHRQVAQWRSAVGLDGVETALDPDGPCSLRGFVEVVLRESGLEAHYRNDKKDPELERLANLGELVSAAQKFDLEFEGENEESDEDADRPGPSAKDRDVSLAAKLNAFLERISLVSDVDAVESGQGAVTLMTLHAAKGLEFPAVAIVAVEEGLLPHSQSQEDERQIEEERRLCFVGITRAQRFLLLSHVQFRTVFGRTQSTIPSRFLGELPRDVIERMDRTDDEESFLGDLATAEGAAQRRDAVDQAQRLPVGSLVKHPQFGLGRVLSVTPAGVHTRARINFESAGAKTLILQYARLERVG